MAGLPVMSRSSGQLWPDQVPVIGSKIAAGDTTKGSAFNADAILRFEHSAAPTPVADHRLRHSQGYCHSRHAADYRECFFKTFHNSIITEVISK